MVLLNGWATLCLLFISSLSLVAAVATDQASLDFNDNDFNLDHQIEDVAPTMAQVREMRQNALRKARRLDSDADVEFYDFGGEETNGLKKLLVLCKPGMKCGLEIEQLSEKFHDRATSAQTIKVESVLFEDMSETVGEEVELWVSPEEIDMISALPGVESIDYDFEIYMNQKVTTKTQVLKGGGMWGLDAGDSPKVQDNKYQYEYDGEGVNCWVLDTGISHNHDQFRHRDVKVADGVNFVRNAVTNKREGGCTDKGALDSCDCNGHGTHVAGIINSKVFGAAKRCNVIPMRVLGCSGGGQFSWVVHALDHISRNVKKGERNIVNLSLGGRKSESLNRAVNALEEKGVVVVVAAGNEAQNSCLYSPASASWPITVGSTQRDDSVSSFTNYGLCVDIYAPGSSIQSAWKGKSRTAIISGTSMAAPHVTAAAAMLWSKYPTWSAKQIRAEVLRIAVKNRISLLKYELNDPNLFFQFPRLKQMPLPPSQEVHMLVYNTNGGVMRFAPAQFGSKAMVLGKLVMASPSSACKPLKVTTPNQYRGKMVLAYRGSCNFYEKAANIEAAGGVAAIISNLSGDYYFEMGIPPSAKGLPMPSIRTILVTRYDGRRLVKMVGSSVAIGPEVEAVEALIMGSVTKAPTASPTLAPSASPTTAPTELRGKCPLRLPDRIGNSMDMTNPSCMYEFRDPTTGYKYKNRCAYSRTPRFGKYKRYTYWSLRRRFNTRGWCMTSPTTWAACGRCN